MDPASRGGRLSPCPPVPVLSGSRRPSWSTLRARTKALQPTVEAEAGRSSGGMFPSRPQSVVLPAPRSCKTCEFTQGRGGARLLLRAQDTKHLTWVRVAYLKDQRPGHGPADRHLGYLRTRRARISRPFPSWEDRVAVEERATKRAAQEKLGTESRLNWRFQTYDYCGINLAVNFTLSIYLYSM